MPPVARLDDHVDIGVLGRQQRKDTVVLDFDKVAAEPRDDPRNSRHLAGHVRHRDTQPCEAALAHQLAHQNRSEQARVDVAARQNGPDTPPPETVRVLRQHGDSGGAGALDECLFDIQQQRNRVLELRLVRQQDVVGVLAHERQRESPELGHRDALRQRVAAAGSRAAVERRFQRRVESGLDADHLDAGLDRFRRERHAADQPTAADRHDQAVEVRNVFDHLERDCALSGDDQRVVERMDERQAAARREVAGERRRVTQLFAMQDHLRPVRLRVLDLHERRVRRHHDRDRYAEALAVIRHGLGMIARRHRDDAAPLLVDRQAQQLVQRAALLERGGELQVLEFQVQVHAENA